MSLVARFANHRSNRTRPVWSCLAALGAVGAVACSATDQGGTSARVGTNEGQNFFEPTGMGGSGGVTPAGQGGSNGFVEPGTPGTGQIDVADACVIDRAQAELVEQPVDIILLLDNSGSMDQELASVEQNINVNFASILIESQVDYRVILISRHRVEPRTESESASTSVCVTPPLGGATNCDATPQPVFTERFFQFNTKVESDDSFDVALDTYAQPISSEYQEDDEDDMPLAPLGWSAWLRPGAKRVFLEMTDDNEDMAPATFIQQLQALTPANFGSDPQNPNFIFHSIVGLAEKADPTAAYLRDEPVQSATCQGDVTNAGETYQELSRMTGGLRFPLCQFNAYDVVFRTIATDVVQTSSIACDFPIPNPPAGSALDLDKVAIQFTPSGGAPAIQFGQAESSGACVSNAFYIADNRLTLCPDTCNTIRNDPRAAVAVLFTCESTIIIQ